MDRNEEYSNLFFFFKQLIQVILLCMKIDRFLVAVIRIWINSEIRDALW